MTGSELLVLFSGLSALAAVAVAVVAALSLTGTRSDSRARTRPVIVAELRPAPLTHGATDLQLRNYGRSAAEDVRVTFDPPLPVEHAPGAHLPFIGKRYEQPIPTFPPGMTLSNVYKAGPEDHDAPERLTVSVSYSASDGKSYSDRFELRSGLVDTGTRSTPSDTNRVELRQVKAIEAVARGVHER